MAEQPLDLEAMWRNVRVALGHTSLDGMLTALGRKLLDLDVPSAESLVEAERINAPIKKAMSRAQTDEECDRAAEMLFVRVRSLAVLLPPEQAECAFLTDQAQVMELLRKVRESAAMNAVAALKQDAEQRGGRGIDAGTILKDMTLSTDGGPSRRDRSDSHSADASPTSDDFDFLASVFGSGPTTPLPNPLPAASPEKPSRESILLEDKEFLTSALIGGPLHGDAETVEDIFVFMKTLWAVNESTVSDILWALSLRLTELGVAAAPSEEETAESVSRLALARTVVAQLNEPRARRRVMDEFRTQMVHLVGLFPDEAQSWTFLDTRAEVLKLIGDRAQDFDGRCNLTP